MVAHCRSIHTVTQSGRTTALDMAQNSGAGVDAGACLNLVCDLLCMADTLGNNNNEVTLAGLLSLSDLIQNITLHVKFLLRQ